MRRPSRPRGSAAALAAGLAAPLLLPASPAAAAGHVPVVVELRDASGAAVGTAVLTPAPAGLRVTAAVRGLAPGFHGFHLHTTGVCDGANGFTGAGGHHVGEGGAHGDHDGDLPSLLALADGTAYLDTVTDAVTIDELLAGDGSAVVVHAGRDNFANIPTDRYDPDPDSTTLATGDAGGRVACGVVAAPTDVLGAGERLPSQDRLVSPDGRSQLVVQADGNVVVYGPTGARFATTTTTVVQLVMQADGNLVAYDAAGRPVWFQYGEPGSTLRMQDDANAVLYAPSGRALWSSTYGRVG